MASFATLKARVESYMVDAPTETVALIGHWLNGAAKYAMDTHNFRFMEETAAFTTDSTAATIAEKRALGDKPDDWKEARTDPWLLEGDGGTKEIRWLPSESEAVRQYAEEDPYDKGEPRSILETPDGFLVYPLPDGQSLWSDGEYRVRIPHWKYLSDLSEDSDTNWFTTNTEDYLTWKATAEAMLFNRDEQRGALWAAKAGTFDPATGKMTGELARIIRLDKRSRLPRRLTLAVRRDVYAPTTQRRSF